MVATHRIMGVLANPVDAGGRLQGIIHQVAQAKTDIMRFIERLQRRPVGVDISHYKDAHRRLLLLFDLSIVLRHSSLSIVAHCRPRKKNFRLLDFSDTLGVYP